MLPILLKPTPGIGFYLFLKLLFFSKAFLQNIYNKKTLRGQDSIFQLLWCRCPQLHSHTLRYSAIVQVIFVLNLIKYELYKHAFTHTHIQYLFETLESSYAWCLCHQLVSHQLISAVSNNLFLCTSLLPSFFSIRRFKVNLSFKWGHRLKFLLLLHLFFKVYFS